MPRFSLFVLLLLAFSMAISACSNTRYDALDRSTGSPAGLPAASPDNRAYALQSDDVLFIKFFYNPELNETVTVRRDGRISLQLVGDIEVAGLMPEEAEKQITERYKAVLRQPEVTVIVQKFAPRLFYIFGEVNKPGGYPHELGMTVVNAVALAGGFTYRASSSEVRLVRASDATRGPQRASRETPVLPGDVIEVPERFF